VRGLSPIVLASLLATSVAQGHDVETHLTPDGVAYLNDNIARAIPSRTEIDDVEVELYECEGDDNAKLTQRNTVIDLDIDTFSLTQPEAGVLRIELLFSALAQGELLIEKPFLCAGELQCTERAAFNDVHAIIELAASGGDDVKISVRDLQLELDEESIDLEISGCALGTLATEILSIGEQLALEKLDDALRKYTDEKLGPMLTGAITKLGDNELELGSFVLNTSIDELDLRSGIRLVADVDIDGADAPACFAAPGEPKAHSGSRPDALAGVPSHFSAAINLGLIDDLLYQLWTSAARCEVGSVDGSYIGDYLTEFPQGTTWRSATTLALPLAVSATDAAGGDITMQIPALDIVLTAQLPNGDEKTARARLKAEVSAAANVDASSSAIQLRVRDVRVTDIVLEDELDLAEQGFDAARIAQLVNDRYLPEKLDSLFGKTVSLPLGYGSGGFYTVLKDLSTTSAYIAIKADLFVAPDSDTEAPDTEITSAPETIVRPEDAIITVSGTDSAIPTPLLSYQIHANGIALPDNSTGWFQIGERGTTNTFSIEVAAVDLAGNVDASPAQTEITVDGIRPQLQILGAPSASNQSIEFYAADDITEISNLAVRVEIVDLNDSSDDRTRVIEVDSGATKVELDGLGDGDHRVTLIVTDEAGNEQVSSHVVQGSSGGCSAGGETGGSLTLMLLGLLLFRIARTRRSRALPFVLACAACSGEPVDPVPDLAELPSCASHLAHEMVDRMLPNMHNSTVPLDLIVGTSTVVDPKVYITGPEIFGKWAALVESAEAEVSMQFYKWEPYTDPTDTILGGLRALQDRRKAEGATTAIDVNIVIDTSAIGAAAPITQDHMPIVMEQFAGFDLDPQYLDVTFAVKERSLTDQFGNLHVKTMVVDGHVGIITGANPEAQHNFEEPWHDIANVFYGDAVDAMLADIDYTWRDARAWQCPPSNDDIERCLTPTHPIVHARLDKPLPTFAEEACAALSLTRQPSSFSNNDIDNPQDQAFLAAFDAAEEVIKIETPNINDDHAKEAILAAAARGVEVRLITSKGFNEVSEGFIGGPNGDNVTELYTRLRLMGFEDACERLQVRWYSHEVGVPILGNAPYASHVKYSTYDSQVVIVGTTNMDTASWNLSHELNIAIDDAGVTNQLDSQLFDADWIRAVTVEDCL